jgi:hypothetical protein
MRYIFRGIQVLQEASAAGHQAFQEEGQEGGGEERRPLRHPARWRIRNQCPRAYLVLPGVTQAGFLREVAKTYPDGKKIQSKVLNDFLGKRGASAGNTSSVFYSSYVFFEKMRIRDGNPKSKHRQEMEKLHPRGFNTSRRHDRVLVREGERPYEDKYGQLHIEGRF